MPARTMRHTTSANIAATVGSIQADLNGRAEVSRSATANSISASTIG